jgi:hypothetical protein
MFVNVMLCKSGRGRCVASVEACIVAALLVFKVHFFRPHTYCLDARGFH